MNLDQLTRVSEGPGFVAALDQSGGSTPKALAGYGIESDAYSDDETMFDLVHEMRARIITSPSFDGERIFGAILFEMTMDREIDGMPTAQYLWERKRIVPFLKVDKGLVDPVDGVQIMAANPDLGELLQRAVAKGIFGTKMRSVIGAANPVGISEVVSQQFDVALQILDAGLVPIVEPEVSIGCPDKGEAESMLRQALVDSLDRLPGGAQIMVKLTLPEADDFYRPLVNDSRIARVVALSGGYSRAEANERLSRNSGVVASFSRALIDGLSAKQSDADFDATLNGTVASIFAASVT